MTHHHHHHDETEATLSFDEKFVKLLKHWIGHNDDHAENYRKWAGAAAENGMPEAAGLLEEAAEMTGQISRKFEKAMKEAEKKA